MFLLMCATIADRFGAVHGKLDKKWSNNSEAGTDCECECDIKSPNARNNFMDAPKNDKTTDSEHNHCATPYALRFSSTFLNRCGRHRPWIPLKNE